MVTLRETRLSSSFQAAISSKADSSILVRIYPLEGIEKPLNLTDERLLIGRDVSCSVQLPDDSVSRRHAAIVRDGEQHVVNDLGSTNGTFVNEKRVEVREVLQNGDRVRFGNQIFKYLKSDEIEVQYHEVVFKMMTTDGLTSIYNKRYFMEALEREVIQAQRCQSPLCVMVLDLDRFKSVNDQHGHLAGDAVLVEFARRAKSVLRSGELLARYGGEEFAMIMTRATLSDAVSAAERLREIIASTPVTFESTEIPITVSIGVHCFDGRSDAKTADLIAAADEMLYRAKNSGRNLVQYEIDVGETWRFDAATARKLIDAAIS